MFLAGPRIWSNKREGDDDKGHRDREREKGYKNNNGETNRNVMEGNAKIQAMIVADKYPS